MKKIDIEEIQSILSDAAAEGIIPSTAEHELLKRVEQVVDELSVEKEATKTPKTKNQFVVVCSEGQYDLPVKDAALWLMQIPVDADHNNLAQQIKQAVFDKNASVRQKKKMLHTLRDAMRGLSNKFLKGTVQDPKLAPKIKTKEPMIVVAAPFQITNTVVNSDI